MDADAMSKIPRTELSAAQFGQASSKITDLKKHHASRWDAETVKNFNAGDLAHIHHSAWEACLPSAYTGFGKSNFGLVPSAATVGMSYEQLAQVPEEARLALTAEQAAQIGKNAKDEPLKAFENLELPEEVKAALSARTLPPTAST